MRFNNLKKRNTSKFNYQVRRLATASLMVLGLTAVVVVPLTSKANNYKAQSLNQTIELADESLDNQPIDENVEVALSENEL